MLDQNVREVYRKPRNGRNTSVSQSTPAWPVRLVYDRSYEGHIPVMSQTFYAVCLLPWRPRDPRRANSWLHMLAATYFRAGGVKSWFWYRDTK
jgi:hypothetical protein